MYNSLGASRRHGCSKRRMSDFVARLSISGQEPVPAATYIYTKLLLMTRIMLAFVAVLGAALHARAQTPSRDDLAHALVGEWYNRYLRVDLNGPSGARQTMEADSTNWEQRLHIKPIHTFFLADGSYYSEYRNLQDSLVRKSTGSWTIDKSDTLVMMEKTPETNTMRLKLTIQGRQATFSGLIDFDGEGKANDVYYGIQQKKATNL